MSFCTGTHWQATDNFSCDACGEGVDFIGYTTATCGFEPWRRCTRMAQGFCDENLRPEAVCQGSWVSLENDGMCSDCELDDQGYLRIACAPGFIGIHRAGQRSHSWPASDHARGGILDQFELAPARRGT